MLLVEDDEGDYLITEDLLSEIGSVEFDLVWASDYESALEAIGREEHAVYLFDYRLVDRSGLELLREVVLRGDRTPAIMLTGQGDREVDLEAMEAGASDYLVKGTFGARLLEWSIRYAIERKKAGEELYEALESFRGAFEDAAVGMALVGTDGRWLRVNQALCEIVGYTEPELLTLTFQDITHQEDLNADLEHLWRVLDGEIRAYQMEKRYLHKNGSVLWILLSVSLVRNAASEPLYFVSQIQDIMGRKELERRLEHESTHDALTGLPNSRRMFMENLERARPCRSARRLHRGPVPGP